MTPAVNTAKKAKIEYTIHEYEHDPANESYGSEAASKLGIPEERMFKTLIVRHGNKEFAVGIVPVSSMLNMKHLAKAIKAKKANLADASDVERLTGYVLGGVSPLGQKKKLKTVIDSSANHFPTIFVSAGRRGMDIELKPQDLARLTNGEFAEISSDKHLAT